MSRTFLGRWVLAVTAGEAIGFMVPAAIGGMMALAAAPAWAVYPVMIAAGACEGALLGLGQSIGFGPLVVPRSLWVAATAAGAAVAWSIGMLPSTLSGFDASSPGTLPWIGIGAGLPMALTVAALTGLAARRIATSVKDHDGEDASG
ncbi:hypothetical protein J2790_001865 [Paenarthrobacter nicotinovorans]|uniref:hypothetical protein n=1 Tax=Micrococcaceae TaxID=1268 RepID=UPI000876EF33|nr:MULTISPECIES: hypothetical protein [Micrococcaceae]MDR6436744.1 hypothetical protein [Paenarthrobacter nicotinovorans]SCZ56740.1 hypothetical protein SAMN02799638_01950 [Arthrobacter sp. UNCCL28]